jgi:hypothetical protein
MMTGDYSARAGMADDTVAAKTGRSWAEWVAVLDAAGAAGMTHTAIAALVNGEHGVPGWWAQTVTVGYERIRGLRDVSQRRDGAYEANRSRTFPAVAESVYAACADEAQRRVWLGDVEHQVRGVNPPKSVRLQFPDGTRAELYITPKGEAKCSLTVAHTRLLDRESVVRSKAEWGTRLDALAALLG